MVSAGAQHQKKSTKAETGLLYPKSLRLTDFFTKKMPLHILHRSHIFPVSALVARLAYRHVDLLWRRFRYGEILCDSWRSDHVTELVPSFKEALENVLIPVVLEDKFRVLWRLACL